MWKKAWVFWSPTWNGRSSSPTQLKRRVQRLYMNCYSQQKSTFPLRLIHSYALDFVLHAQILRNRRSSCHQQLQIQEYLLIKLHRNPPFQISNNIYVHIMAWTGISMLCKLPVTTSRIVSLPVALDNVINHAYHFVVSLLVWAMAFR